MLLTGHIVHLGIIFSIDTCRQESMPTVARSDLVTAGDQCAVCHNHGVFRSGAGEQLGQAIGGASVRTMTTNCDLDIGVPVESR